MQTTSPPSKREIKPQYTTRRQIILYNPQPSFFKLACLFFIPGPAKAGHHGPRRKTGNRMISGTATEISGHSYTGTSTAKQGDTVSTTCPSLPQPPASPTAHTHAVAHAHELLLRVHGSERMHRRNGTVDP
jgi:hypothetical protein